MTRPSYRIGLITTHPIQYQAPWFRALALHDGIDVEVYFCHQASSEEQAAAGFGVQFDWDIPLLDGYRYRFMKNMSRTPSIHHFSGLDNPEIKEIVTKGRFDAVIVNGWHYKTAWQTIRACWKTGTPIMVRSDSHLHTERNSLKRVGKWPLYRWFIPRIDGCLPTGTWSKDYFIHYGARPERTFIVPHVIDTKFFKRESENLRHQRNDLRAKWGIADDKTVFVFAGKLSRKKRPLDFVRAIGEAARDGAAVAGLMAGDGPLRSACQELALSNSLPICFTGFLNQSEISKAYVASDVLVLPSDGGETWGLVVNEAMACGLPCLVSDRVGSGPDMIITGETGYVFPLGDVTALAAHMCEMASKPARLRSMSRHSQRKAEEYSVEMGVQGVMSALNGLLQRRDN